MLGIFVSNFFLFVLNFLDLVDTTTNQIDINLVYLKFGWKSTFFSCEIFPFCKNLKMNLIQCFLGLLISLFGSIYCESHYLNQWAVKIDGNIEDAERIARQNGYLLETKVCISLKNFSIYLKQFLISLMDSTMSL